MVNDLTVFRGDDKTWDLTFKDRDGTAIDLTGGSIFFTVKNTKTDIDADAVITKNITSFLDATAGSAQISVTDDDTDLTVTDYFYDVQWINSSGEVITVMDGLFKVQQDVTTRISA